MNSLKYNISGFVLAGGKSSRMGYDKGFIKLNGQRLIEYSFNVLKEVCSTVHVISNNSEYDFLGCEVYPDFIKDKGPLSGICTALIVSKTNLNIILSCDSPFVSSTLLYFLLNHLKTYDAVVPYYQSRLYPLAALYTKACYSTFNKLLLKNDLRIKDALGFVNTNQVELSHELSFFDKKMLANINTKQELNLYEN